MKAWIGVRTSLPPPRSSVDVKQGFVPRPRPLRYIHIQCVLPQRLMDQPHTREVAPTLVAEQPPSPHPRPLVTLRAEGPSDVTIKTCMAQPN